MYDVVALGELLIDFVHQGNNDVGYPLMQGNPGGAPGNFLSTLSKFGAKTGFLGKVGSDRFGRMLVKTFRDAGVETKGILVDDRYFTTLAFVTLDDSGDREFSFARSPVRIRCSPSMSCRRISLRKRRFPFRNPVHDRRACQKHHQGGGPHGEGGRRHDYL